MEKVLESPGLQANKQVDVAAFRAANEKRLKLFEIRAQSSLALCEIAEGRQSESIPALKIAVEDMRKLVGEKLYRYAWIADRYTERLAKFEGGQ